MKSTVFADEPPSVVTSSAPVDAPYVAVPYVAPVGTPVFSSPVSSAPVDSFLAKLRSKLQEPGSVIEKFENSLSSLSMIPDMGMRVTAAISVLRASAGIDVKHLQACYSERVNVLNREAIQFGTAVAQQNQNEVGAKQDQLKQISADIESKGLEIQALIVKREAVDRDIAAAKTRLDAARAGFDGAVGILRAEIQDAVARLSDIAK